MKSESSEQATIHVRMHLCEFVIPPVTDALVIGKSAPIGSEAMRRALRLLHVASFDRIPIENDKIVEDILIRESVLNKIPREKLVQLVIRRIKPLMTAEEVIHIDLKAELTIEEEI